MQSSEAKLRLLPAGPEWAACASTSRGRVLEVELQELAAECTVGKAAELESEAALYLGIIERRENRRVWIAVEHMLDRRSLAALSVQWREKESKGAH
jgi:hypothetical protein